MWAVIKGYHLGATEQSVEAFTDERRARDCAKRIAANGTPAWLCKVDTKFVPSSIEEKVTG